MNNPGEKELEELRQWVRSEDEPPLRQAQMAALLPMNYFLGCWRQGLDKVAIKSAGGSSQDA